MENSFSGIEDTDPERSQEKYTDQILESLTWLGLHWDQPVVYQSQRLDVYKERAKALTESGQVYRCFCSKADLLTARDAGHYQYPGTCRNLTEDEIKLRLNQGIGFTMRLRIPEGKTTYKDLSMVIFVWIIRNWMILLLSGPMDLQPIILWS